MSVRAGAALAVVVVVTAACSSDPSPTATPGEASSSVRAPKPTPQALPPGDLLAARTGTGSTRLGAVTVDEAATLFFQCKVGTGATIKYGSGSQVCPDQNSLIGVVLSPDASPLDLAVEASPGTEWAVSVSRDTRR